MFPKKLHHPSPSQKSSGEIFVFSISRRSSIECHHFIIQVFKRALLFLLLLNGFILQLSPTFAQWCFITLAKPEGSHRGSAEAHLTNSSWMYSVEVRFSSCDQRRSVVLHHSEAVCLSFITPTHPEGAQYSLVADRPTFMFQKHRNVGKVADSALFLCGKLLV